MGLVYAKIKLTNADDMALVKRNYLKKEEVRSLSIAAMVDSGAYMLAINQTIKAQLGLDVIDKRTAQLADGSTINLDIVGPIEVRFENRMAMCNAMVLPGDSEMLLGAIPMEEMDVLIHPNQNKLIVNPLHPNVAQLSLKGLQADETIVFKKRENS
jgi:clan AA aspartic protease